MTEKRKPWMKFYVDNWRANARLRLCGLGARGLWIDMIAIMHKADPYGHFLVDGLQPTLEDTASIANAPVKFVKAALEELDRRKVFSRTEDGTIYSRKMVRDHEASLEGRENIKKRWASREDDSHPNRVPTQEPNSKEDRGQKKESEAKASVVNPPDLIADAVEAFNAVAKACGLPKAQSITPKRRAGIKARMKECGGLEGWRQACELIREHQWMHGANKDGWRLSLDDLITPKIFTKLMEGAYDRSGKATSQNGSGIPGQRSGKAGSPDVGRIAMELLAEGREQRVRAHGVPPDGTDQRGTATGDSFPFEGFDGAGRSGTDHRGSDAVPDGDKDRTEAGRQRQADDGRLHGGVIEIPG